MTDLLNIVGTSSKTAIATTTFYNPNSKGDTIRAENTIEAIKTANELGYKIIVVDGGSPDELLKNFEKYGATLYPQESKGMGAGRRQAIKEAFNTEREIIAWTEPEKVSYILELVKTVRPILNNSADLVVPKRRSLKSYPLIQQYTELSGNLFFKNLTGYELDMWIGPRTWRRELSDYFLDYNGEYGDKWDSIFIPVLNAIANGERVISVNVNYTHPKKQTQIEENNLEFDKKRINQLATLTSAMQTHWEKISN